MAFPGKVGAEHLAQRVSKDMKGKYGKGCGGSGEVRGLTLDRESVRWEFRIVRWNDDNPEGSTTGTARDTGTGAQNRGKTKGCSEGGVRSLKTKRSPVNIYKVHRDTLEYTG